MIDGCHRAVCLYHRLQDGHPVPQAAELYGSLPQGGLEFLAAAVSPLWP